MPEIISRGIVPGDRQHETTMTSKEDRAFRSKYLDEQATYLETKADEMRAEAERYRELAKQYRYLASLQQP